MDPDTQRLIYEAVTEKEFQDTVVQELRLYGFEVFHDFDSRRNQAGFPDVVAVHRDTGVTAFYELKTEKGKLRPAQQVWLDALSRRNRAKVVRPSEWDAEVKLLVEEVRRRS